MSQPNTPTPVRGVGTTEQLSSHRGDDNPNHEGFDRQVFVNREHGRDARNLHKRTYSRQRKSR